MATSQIGLYNDALGHIGERQLLTLTENREPRRALDAIYASVLGESLEAGYWKPARRTVQLTASDTLTPQFGYEFVFDVPADCLQLYLVSMSPDGQPPLNDYVMEAGFLRCHFQTIYVTYVSNDPNFGLNLTRWAPSFARWVAAELAARVAYRLTQSREIEDKVEKKALKLKKAALSRDAMEGPPGEQPTGTWVSSRRRGGMYPLGR